MNLEAALKPYLDTLQKDFDEYLTKKEWKPEELYEAVKHLPLHGGGKRLRPLMATLAAQAVGGDARTVVPLCLSLELLHCFTLVHDDIMDDCDTRRGVEAVHAKFGTNMGILAGDTLFSMVFEKLGELEVSAEIYREISTDMARLAREVCEGQYWDMAFESKKKVEELDYYHMIERKTATFFETAMRNGARAVDGDPHHVKKLSECGRLLGLSFQVWDDYLGIMGKEEDTGKPQYSDILRCKKTLPYVACHSNLDSFDRRQFVDLYRKLDKSEDDVKKIMAFLEKSGSVDYTKDRARKFSNYAKAAISDLPETAAKRMLQLLADHASTRTS